MVNKIAICDDVEVERFVLKRQLMVYFQKNGGEAQIQEYESGESLLADVEDGYLWPDLIFLDIYMGALNGMDTAARLRRLDSSVALIFITSMARYAIRGYEVEAMDFLLKPVSYPMFSARIQRALRKSSQEQPQTLLINMSDGVYRIASTRIKYVEVTDHYLVYHTTEGNLNTYGKLKDVEEKLDKINYHYDAERNQFV